MSSVLWKIIEIHLLGGLETATDTLVSHDEATIVYCWGISYCLEVTKSRRFTSLGLWKNEMVPI